MKRNILIGQSGGPSVAINASLAGIIRQAMCDASVGEIYGALHGMEGVLQGKLLSLRPFFHTGADFERLIATPAMALGSCRYKLPSEGAEYEAVQRVFEQYNIDSFFYIGGNDSMDTVDKLSSYFAKAGSSVRCIGIPKTIDNDLCHTDHTPGFGSAARYVASTVAEIGCDSAIYDLPSVTVIEIMGRNAGWLTAAAALARHSADTPPHLLYLPEVPFDSEACIVRTEALLRSKRNVIIAVSEGVHSADGVCLADRAQTQTDAFGHGILSGAGRALADLLGGRLGCKTRAIELNVMQRSAAHLASSVDLREAYEIGAYGVKLAQRGESGVMASICRVSEEPYLVRYEPVPVAQVANRERRVPREWIAPSGDDITPELLAYLRPIVYTEAVNTDVNFFRFKE